MVYNRFVFYRPVSEFEKSPYFAVDCKPPVERDTFLIFISGGVLEYYINREPVYSWSIKVSAMLVP